MPMDLLHVTIFSCNPKCNASKHYLFYNLHIHESLPHLRDFVCVCVCVCVCVGTRVRVLACVHKYANASVQNDA